jgi:hypothetical protein
MCHLRGIHYQITYGDAVSQTHLRSGQGEVKYAARTCSNILQKIQVEACVDNDFGKVGISHT